MAKQSTEAKMAAVREALVRGVETGHQIQIEPPAITDIPTRDEIARRHKDKYLLDYVDILTQFLKMPIVEDNFGNDDNSRDAWGKKVHEHYGEIGDKIIGDNKLRPNKFQMVYGPLQEIPGMIEEENANDKADADAKFDTGAAATIRTISSNLDKRPTLIGDGRYKDLTLPQKKAIANQLTMAAVCTLHLLAGQGISQDRLDFIKSGYLSS